MTVNEKILKIMQLALEISPADVLDEDAEERPHVYVDYAPHCPCLTVQVYKNGWHWDEEPCAEWQTVVTGYYRLFGVVTERSGNETLDEIIAYLEAMKGELDHVREG